MCQNVNALTENWCSGVIQTNLLAFSSRRNVQLDPDIAPPCFSLLCPTVAVDGYFRGKYLAPSMLLAGCLVFLPKQKVFWYKTAVVSRLDLSLEWWELIILNSPGTSVNTLNCQNKCPAFLNPEILHCFCLPMSRIPYASLHTAYEHFPSVFSKQVALAANLI